MTAPGGILIVSHDVVGARMAGPGIRYYHLARSLSREFDVSLAIPGDVLPALPGDSFRLAPYRPHTWESLEPLVRAASVVVFPGGLARDFPQLDQSGIPLAVDGYDPLLAEGLAASTLLPEVEKQPHWWGRMIDLQPQYLMGDFFMCASERQRDWWLGLLEMSGRVNPWTFGEDASLRRLIDVVPFGLPEEPPRRTRAVIKGVWPGIGPDDRVILWGGGLWPWLDPLTAIRAVARVWARRPSIRLVFPGMRHPNPIVAQMPTHNQAAQALAEELGVLDRAVFFGDWLPYADWPDALLESDLALSLHFDTLETRLAFRSRVLEYIWAGLPSVATEGDATSELVERHGLGRVVPYADVAAVAEAIEALLDTPRADLDQAFALARPQLTWARAVRPLAEFCRQPRIAPDKAALRARLGNPYYLNELAQREADAAQLQAQSQAWAEQVQAFEQTRPVRLMRWIDRHILGVREANGTARPSG